MNIFVESASLDEIRSNFRSGFADGVVLNDASSDHALISAISQEFAIPICVDVAAIKGADIYREAREVARISDHIIVEVPLVEDAIEPMHKLSLEGVGICATFVYTAAQAVLAAKAGASMVRVSLSDLDDHGRTSSDVVSEIRSLLEASDCECDVMVASPGSSTQFTECITAGAQIISIRPDVLQSLLLHPLTDRGLDRFLSGLSRRPKQH